MLLFFQQNVAGDRSGEFTGLFSLTPLTNGADYFTASGIRYDAPADDVPVPEPGSLVLLGAGLAMLSRRFRSRRRSR